MTDNSPVTIHPTPKVEPASDFDLGWISRVADAGGAGTPHVIRSLIARIRAETAKNSGDPVVEPARYLDTRSGAVVTPKYYNSVISSRDMFEPLYTTKQLQAIATPANSRAEPVGSLHVDEYGGYDFDLTQSLSEGGYDLFTHPSPSGSRDTPVVAVKPMRLSDGRVDYYVSIQVGTREVTPHVFGAEYKAAYHVALYDWLLNGGSEPDILAFDKDDFPAQKTVANSRAEAIGAREADSPLLAASYYAMSKAMELLDADLGHGTVLNMLAKCRVDIENRRALLDTQQPDSRAEAIGVKPLEWLSDREPFFASTPFCTYRISPVNDDTGPHWQTDIRYQGSMYQRHDTEAEAKAAAQADYEQRIRSALLQQEGE